MSITFFTLRLDHLSQEQAEVFAAEAFSNGALGTEEILPFKQDGKFYEPTTLDLGETSLKIYFSEPPKNEWLRKLLDGNPGVTADISEDENKDWLAEWKKGFVPFELGKDIWVVPSWCEKPASAKSMIIMDPGMAFGTGTHETTKLASSFLIDYAKGESLFDVGTGTGILAFLAELKGFKRILANDIDAEAVRVARENAELNGIKNVQVTTKDITEIDEHFDWVVANIIDGVLSRMQNSLKERVKSKGYLLLTGILAEREQTFREEFSFAGFNIVERRQLNEWVGYLLKEKG